MTKIVIGDLAHSRSGDKGNDANIALFAYTKAGYQQLLERVTEKKVMEIFAPLGVKKVTRYEVPNLLAINYVLEDVLDGGGSLSLRSDSQGKALAQVLLLQSV
jgi:hypothetical protein